CKRLANTFFPMSKTNTKKNVRIADDLGWGKPSARGSGAPGKPAAGGNGAPGHPPAGGGGVDRIAQRDAALRGVATTGGAAPDDSKTLRRGLALMDALLHAPPGGLRVVELCSRTGLSRATVHRLLATLL